MLFIKYLWLFLFPVLLFGQQFNPETAATFIWHGDEGVVQIVDSVDTWTSQKGTAVMQGAEGSRPEPNAAGNGVVFDGGDFLSSTVGLASAGTDPFTLEVYVKLQAINAIEYFVSWWENDNTNGIVFRVGADQKTQGQVQTDAVGWNFAVAASSDWTLNKTAYISFGRVSGGGSDTLKARLANGVLVSTAYNGELADLDQSETLVMGARNDETSKLTGTIYEVRWVNGAYVTAGEQTRYKHYLTTRYDNIEGYYFSSAGDDTDAGTSAAPWATTTKLDSTYWGTGDSLFFNGGDTFASLTLYSDIEYLGGYGTGLSTITTLDANSIALTIDLGHLNITNITNADNVTYINQPSTEEKTGYGGYSNNGGFGGW